MRREAMRYLLGTFLLLATVAAFAPRLNASDTDEATLLTFHQSVRIPGGKVLPVGTYLFTSVVRLSDDTYGVVRISSPDGSRVFATLMTRYISRPQLSLGTQLSFAEPLLQQQPMTLLSWFYPGSFSGHEFLYSTQDANRIEEETQITIVATPDSRVVTSRILDLPIFD